MKFIFSVADTAVMSSSDLRARMDGLEGLGKADAVYPEPLSRHNRGLVAQQQVGKQHSTLIITSAISSGDLEEPHHEEAFFQGMRSGDLECSPHMYKRTVKKKQDRRGRFRTQPVTFMEIKVVIMMGMMSDSTTNFENVSSTKVMGSMRNSSKFE